MTAPASYQKTYDLLDEARELIADAAGDGMSSVAHDVLKRLTAELEEARPKPIAPGETPRPGLYRGGSDVAFGLFRLKQNGVWLFSSAISGYAWRISRDTTGEGLTLLAASDC